MKDPAFLLYSKDFQSGTQEMTCEEVGFHIRLLLYQHRHLAIPNNKERLMRITGIFSVDKFDEIWQIVGPKFNETGDKLINERLAVEMAKRAKNKPLEIAQRTYAGLMSANKKSIP